MNNITKQFTSIEQIANSYLKQPTQSANESEVSFQSILDAKKQKNQKDTSELSVRFSKHASERLQERNINLSQEQLNRLHDGVEQARGKNIKDSLVMVDNVSFIVNITNNTVVTAMEEKEQTIFTNIDGVVIS